MNYEELLKEIDTMKDEMTNTERMIAYSKGELVDRIPYRLIGADTASTLYGYTIGQYRESTDIKCDVIKKVVDEFGGGGIGVGPGLKGIGEALGSKVVYPEEGMDYVSDHILEDYKLLDNMDIINPYKDGPFPQMLEEFKYLRERFPNLGAGTGVAGPFSTAVSIRRPENVLKDIIKNKDKLNQLLDFSIECSLRWVEVVKKEIGEMHVNIADPFGSLTVISKKQFNEFSTPHLKKLIDGIENIMGTMPSIHICGRTRGIWEELVDLGFTSLSLDNCEDLEEVKNTVGDRIALSGNIPPVEIMKYGTIDEVIESVRICLLKASDNPMGYSLAAGCQIPLGTPRENLYAFVYAAKKYGRGAQKGKMCEGLY